jgi:glucose/arabinose dehydrogenase
VPVVHSQSPRGGRLGLTGAVLFLCLASGLLDGQRLAERASADSAPGFISEVAYSNLPTSTDFAFAPDGRIFVASKNGVVRVIDHGALQSTPFITLSHVNTYWDRGLESIAVDPDFATNHYFYLYYVYENDPGHIGAAKTAQLLRVTANGNIAVPGSELVLLGRNAGNSDSPSCQDLPPDCIPADGASHNGGGLAFGTDGSLFLSTGDAAMFFSAVPPDLTSRPQDLDSLAGKLLRINRVDGSGFADNPFYTGNTTDNRSRVWSYGLRNPFRLTVDPTTGRVLVGDVGSDYWEEIDEGAPGANFGWPCYEGTAQHPTQNTFPVCQALYASGVETAHPLYTYARGDAAAVIGGVVYHGANYPANFAGAYIFGDWSRHIISYLPADPSSGALVPNAQQLFGGNDAGSPVEFEVAPDGDVYYLSWDASPYGEIHHIRYVPGNRPPVARASVAPVGGLAPLEAHFSSEGSWDPDGDPLSFAWDIDFGDGGTSTDANPVHTYTTNGPRQVRLTVKDSHGAQSSTTVRLVVGNQPPKAIIKAPLPNSGYIGEQTISLVGTGLDAEDGRLSDSGLSWTVLLHHCFLSTLSCHTHPFQTFAGATGSLSAPSEGGNDMLYLEIQLTVTDSVGLSDTATEFIGPDADGDGALDEQEILTLHTDPLNPDTDGDGCTDGEEQGPNQSLGGLRDPLNPWDYFNPSGDGRNRIDDVLMIVKHYGLNRGDPGYDPRYDRSYLGPNPWNLGPPNGSIGLSDVLAELAQFHHDCRRLHTG